MTELEQMKIESLATKSLEHRIEKLEKENEKLSVRGMRDEIFDNIDSLISINKSLLERIEALEKHQGEMSVALDTDNKRIESLEKKVATLGYFEKVLMVLSNNDYEKFNTYADRIEALEKDNQKIWEYCQSVMGDCVQQVEDLQKERDLGVERLKILEQRSNAMMSHLMSLEQRLCIWIDNVKFGNYSNQVKPDISVCQEKKEGLTFVEAMTKLFEGKKVKRPAWNDYIDIKKITEYKDSSSLFYSAFLANDWMVLDD